MKQLVWSILVLLIFGAGFSVYQKSIINKQSSRSSSIVSQETSSDISLDDHNYKKKEDFSGLNLNDSCGHNLDSSIAKYGFNLVVDKNGSLVLPQGRPFQEGYRLIKSNTYVEDYNQREYAQIFSIMAPIRDALMCDLDSVKENEWDSITKVLVLNGLKQTQSLTGTPKERYYSSEGIYEHLTSNGPNFHPMMKFLEEAELELKCLGFINFNFVNPEGKNHCQINNIEEGSGIILPN